MTSVQSLLPTLAYAFYTAVRPAVFEAEIGFKEGEKQWRK